MSNNINTQQVGGTHYSQCSIQPIEYIHANNLNFDEGSIVKYITRHRNKNKSEDIMKIIQYATFILSNDYDFSNEDIKNALLKLVE